MNPIYDYPHVIVHLPWKQVKRFAWPFPWITSGGEKPETFM